MLLLHQLQQPPLAHDGIVEVQPGELDLSGLGGDVHLAENPVVELAVVLELQGAERVGHAFQRVGQGVGEIVHGIDGPRVAGVVVGDVTDAVDHRIAHLHIRRRHFDPGAQDVGAVRELAVPHAGEEVQVLVHTAAPVRALPARLGDRAPGLADLRLAQAAYVRAAALDELHGEAVQFLEVVGGVVQTLAPVEPEPPDVVLDGFDVAGVLLGGVGVVETQVAAAAELTGDAEVEADGLGVADVEKAVGLGREACHHPAGVPAGGHVVPDDGADEVQRRLAPGGAVGLFRLAHGSACVSGACKAVVVRYGTLVYLMTSRSSIDR